MFHYHENLMKVRSGKVLYTDTISNRSYKTFLGRKFIANSEKGECSLHFYAQNNGEIRIVGCDGSYKNGYIRVDTAKKKIKFIPKQKNLFLQKTPLHIKEAIRSYVKKRKEFGIDDSEATFFKNNHIQNIDSFKFESSGLSLKGSHTVLTKITLIVDTATDKEVESIPGEYDLFFMTRGKKTAYFGEKSECNEIGLKHEINKNGTKNLGKMDITGGYDINGDNVIDTIEINGSIVYYLESAPVSVVDEPYSH